MKGIFVARVKKLWPTPKNARADGGSFRASRCSVCLKCPDVSAGGGDATGRWASSWWQAGREASFRLHRCFFTFRRRPGPSELTRVTGNGPVHRFTSFVKRARNEWKCRAWSQRLTSRKMSLSFRSPKSHPIFGFKCKPCPWIWPNPARGELKYPPFYLQLMGLGVSGGHVTQIFFLYASFTHVPPPHHQHHDPWFCCWPRPTYQNTSSFYKPRPLRLLSLHQNNGNIFLIWWIGSVILNFRSI